VIALPAEWPGFVRWWADGLLRASWQGGLAILAAYAIGALFPRMPAAARCWLWRLAYLKLLIGFLAFAPIHLHLLPANLTPVPIGSFYAQGGSSRVPQPVAPSPQSEGPAPAPARPHVAVSGVIVFGLWLVATVRQQAQAAGIGMPEVGVFDAPDMNAFATGPRRNNALVAVSSGLLRGMSRREAEAVLGHEISHVANGDMVTLTLIQGVVNTFVIFLSRVIGYLIDRVVFKTERGHGPAFLISVIVAQLVLGILASMIVMWFSRRREFRADAGGAKLEGREPMIAALERLRQQHPQPLPDQMAAFGISGMMRQGLMRLFMSHPPLEERIAALRAQ